MPNTRQCAIQGCDTHFVKGGNVSLFNVSKSDDEWSKNWREKVYNIVKRDREMTTDLKNLMLAKTLAVCELHYEADCILHRK